MGGKKRLTNDEAINVLKNAVSIGAVWIGDEKQFYDLLDAVEMAVEALQREISDDTISRQLAIDAADKIIERDKSGNNDVVKAMIAWKVFVEGLPSVQPTHTNTPNTLKSLDCVDRQKAIDAMATTLWHYPTECMRNINKYEFAKGLAELGLKSLPSVQPEPFWGKTVEDGRPLADREIVSRLRDIQKQVGGSYAIDRAIEVIEAVQALPSVQPVGKDINVSCKDAISRQAAIDALGEQGLITAMVVIDRLPSVQPTYTDAAIQKMQDLHQAEIEKAFELGREDARSEVTHCGECKHKGTKNCVANVWAAILGVTVKDDFYCGLAERRTDERTD